MDYRGLVKRLQVPDGYLAPRAELPRHSRARDQPRRSRRGRPRNQRQPRHNPAHPRRRLAHRPGHCRIQLRRPGLARMRVPGRRLVHLRGLRRQRAVPRMLLPVPARRTHAANGRPAALRRRRQLVGYPCRLPAGVLPGALPGAAALDQQRLPFPGRLLLQHRDPAADPHLNPVPDPDGLTVCCPFDRMLS